MGHKSNKIYDEVISTLNSMAAFGQSKYHDKKDNTIKNKIYSYVTFDIYKRHCIAFATFAKKEHKCKSLNEARPYAGEYLRSKVLAGHSAWSVKLYACALAKMYQVSSNSFTPLPPRLRSSIMRSRFPTKNDSHFSNRNNLELIRFCQHTGLRRAELENLKGRDLIKKDGMYYIHVVSGKGGKERYSQILNNDPEVIGKMKSTQPDKRVWGHVVPLDIHSFRADYARSLYLQCERLKKDIPRCDRYYCRRDLKGFIYDKKAMEIVSQALGHNRINVVAYSYLHP